MDILILCSYGKCRFFIPVIFICISIFHLYVGKQRKFFSPKQCGRIFDLRMAAILIIPASCHFYHVTAAGVRDNARSPIREAAIHLLQRCVKRHQG